MSEQLPGNNSNPHVGHEADAHLDRLLSPTAASQMPWYLGLVQGIKELINPPKLPPLEITSKPIEVKKISMYSGNEWKAGLISTVVNISVIALLIVITTNDAVQQQIKEAITLVAPVMPKVERPSPPKQQQQGGGGGGNKSPLEASKGKLPRPAPRVFVPPTVTPPDNPKLPMTPTIMASDLPQIDMANYGDPNGRLGIPSNGTGIGGSIGSGKGPGVGPGEGGGFGGGVFKIGGGVSSPVPTFKPEPEYSEEARKAKYQGDVLIQLVVDENGNPTAIKVVRPLGLGLDEKAVEAVTKWRFKPGMKDGKPVKVQATIQVTFRLL